MTELKAFAKVNLCLYVTGVRNDGYHLLDTVMQSISLYDSVSVSVTDECEICVTCSNGAINGEENICYKAATLFFEETKINGGCNVNIVKRIPIAAGLGGGSSDAAAVLKGLNLEYGCPLNEEALLKLALRLGADVPFCVKGGTAVVKGIGEEMKTVKNKLPIYMVLIKEGDKPSTGFMYKELDKRIANKPIIASSEKLCNALESADYNTFISALYNEFAVLWNIDSIKTDLTTNGADGVCLSGSGPSVIGFFKSFESAERAYCCLREKYKNAYLVQNVNE